MSQSNSAAFRRFHQQQQQQQRSAELPHYSSAFLTAADTCERTRSQEEPQFSRESALKTNIRLSVFLPFFFFSSAARLWPAEISVQNFRAPTFIVAVDFSIAEPGQFQKFRFEGIKVNMVWGRVGWCWGLGGGEEEGDGVGVKGRRRGMGR